MNSADVKLSQSPTPTTSPLYAPVRVTGTAVRVRGAFVYTSHTPVRK